MNTYEFTLVLRSAWDKEDLTDEMVGRFPEAGCDDGTTGVSECRLSVIFGREAESAVTAILSAIRDVRAAGFDVERIAEADLIRPAVYETSIPFHEPGQQFMAVLGRSAGVGQARGVRSRVVDRLQEIELELGQGRSHVVRSCDDGASTDRFSVGTTGKAGDIGRPHFTFSPSWTCLTPSTTMLSPTATPSLMTNRSSTSARTVISRRCATPSLATT